MSIRDIQWVQVVCCSFLIYTSYIPSSFGSGSGIGIVYQNYAWFHVGGVDKPL